MTDETRRIVKKNEARLNAVLGKKATEEQRADFIEKLMKFFLVLTAESGSELRGDRSFDIVALNMLVTCKLVEMKADFFPSIDAMEELEALQESFNKLVGYEHFKKLN